MQVPPDQVQEMVSASSRMIPRDPSTEICPFCHITPSQTEKALARHIGKHLQEVSFAALPNMESSSQDSISDGDSNHYYGGDDDNDSRAQHAENPQRLLYDDRAEDDKKAPLRLLKGIEQYLTQRPHLHRFSRYFRQGANRVFYQQQPRSWVCVDTEETHPTRLLEYFFQKGPVFDT